MTITLNDIKYPTLNFLYDGNYVYVAVLPRDYETFNRSQLWKGICRNSYYIDADGKKYNIISYKKQIEYFNLFTFIFEPDYKIYINFSEPEQLTIEDIKVLVVEALKRDGIKKKKVYTGI